MAEKEWWGFHRAVEGKIEDETEDLGKVVAAIGAWWVKPYPWLLNS
ncbi:MAG: hypothetical protein U0931_35860 [Vulcanimicrobiota bacterium]